MFAIYHQQTAMTYPLHQTSIQLCANAIFINHNCNATPKHKTSTSYTVNKSSQTPNLHITSTDYMYISISIYITKK